MNGHNNQHNLMIYLRYFSFVVTIPLLTFLYSTIHNNFCDIFLCKSVPHATGMTRKVSLKYLVLFHVS